jgi:hypothetical protein
VDIGDCGLPRLFGRPGCGGEAVHLSECRFRQLGLRWFCSFRLRFILVNGKYDFEVTEVTKFGRRDSRGYEHYVFAELVPGLPHRRLY